MDNTIKDMVEFEKRFQEAVKTVSVYEGNIERTTLDKEWTESELLDEIRDEAIKLLEGSKDNKGWIEKNKVKDKALYDADLLLPEYLANKIIDEYDCIELYNAEVDKHRKDTEKDYGINHFDRLIIKKMTKILKDNIVKTN